MSALVAQLARPAGRPCYLLFRAPVSPASGIGCVSVCLTVRLSNDLDWVDTNFLNSKVDNKLRLTMGRSTGASKCPVIIEYF